ncbi:hypothetical protein CGCS363_v007389 [Colletotrichum siamense]|uniref:uncharacterized protein n=1 Tax=Colletotrichum siamense TaxID=690259 RepID=UPI0018729BBD|nr:uncharacterized protein CGCS363_v007389 [Colletotrichum siamense]KAF5501651.1 hypothetical protein CGCS363_v007389 [Colletotrichum siamense]
MGNIISLVSTSAHTINAFAKQSKELHAKLTDLQDPAKLVLDTAGVIAKTLSFNACSDSLFKAVKTLSGGQAHGELIKLGGQIQKNVEQISNGVDSLNNHQNQKSHSFPQHVHDFIASCYDENSEAGEDEYFFVYHPGTDWYPAFNRLLKEYPLPKFCGTFHSIGAMSVFLEKFRLVIGPDPTINILVPAVHLFVVPDEIEIPSDLFPIRIRGELHQSGNPYVHVNIRNSSPLLRDCLYNVANINKISATNSDAKAANRQQNVHGNWRRKVYSISRAAAVGAPAAAKHMATCRALSGLLATPAAVVCPPLLVTVAVGCAVAALSCGAVAGIKPGKAAKEDAEIQWDRRFGAEKGSLSGHNLLAKMKEKRGSLSGHNLLAKMKEIEF